MTTLKYIRSTLMHNLAGSFSTYTMRVAKAIMSDIVIVLVAYFAVYSVRTVSTSLSDLNAIPFMIFVVSIMIAALYLFGSYHRIWSHSSGHEITLIFNAVAVVTLIIVFVALILPTRPVPLSVIVVANALATSGFIAVRYRSRLITGASWRWKAIWKHEFPDKTKETCVLIVGAGESGQTLAWRLKHRFEGHHYRIVGFVDDDKNKQHMFIEGCQVLGTRCDIVAIAERQHVDLIVVAVHNISGADFREIVGECEKTKALIKVVPNILRLMNATNSGALLRDLEPEDLIGRKPITRSKNVDLSAITYKTILITGAAGSIGSELSRQIVEYEPTKVVLLDNNESGLHDLVTEIHTRCPEIDLTAVLADITVAEVVEDIFEQYRPQVVFHAAAYKHVPMLQYYPREALRVNIHGTLNVAKYAGEFGTERFVLISTDKAVNPTSVMGASKRVGELFLHALSVQGKYQTLYTSVRFGNVLGSRGSVIPTFTRQIESGGPVTVTHPDMTRYFMSIPEAVNLIIHAACLTNGDGIYMLKMGEVVKIVELAERMIRMRGLRPYKDIDIQFTGIRPGEKMHEELHDQSELPIETIHPSIVRLKLWADQFDAQVFLADLHQVMSDKPKSEDDMLKALLHVINGDNIPKVMPQLDNTSHSLG
jgi:FlaA1/EpsC-like NDP-sugar epimerase